MRALILSALFVALSMAIAAPAMAGSGHKMAENHTPQSLANAIERSLAEDPAGGGIIDGTACTRPIHYWEAIEEANDDIRFNSFADMVSFIRSLVRMEGASSQYPGSYSMARTLGTVGGECRLDMIGYSRGFRLGEDVWMDPKTGKPILAEDCANVVRIPQQVVEVPPAPVPPEPQCVDVPKGNIAFPAVEDIEAWKACNPQHACAEDCIDWLLHGTSRGDHSSGSYVSDKVQSTTGMNAGTETAAFRGYNLKAPANRSTVHAAVLCQENTNKRWTWHGDGNVQRGP